MKILAGICLVQAITITMLVASRPAPEQPVSDKKLTSVSLPSKDQNRQPPLRWTRSMAQSPPVEVFDTSTAGRSIADNSGDHAPKTADTVDRLFSELESLGSADQAALEQLQIAIAKLPANQRQRMMSRLMRAMNDGRIHGTLL